MPAKLHTPRILVAPLNWGLGHATRCIPLIRQLQQEGCEVITASDGDSRSLLVEEFPLLTHLSSPHAPIRYSKKKIFFGWAMVRLLPRLLQQVHREKRWIKKIVAQYRITGIIADNRYGLAHSAIHSVIITHQLGIRTGMGKTMDRLAQRLLYHWIDQYHQVWVPDIAETPSLAGALSHPRHLPAIPLVYIGLLNRLHKKPQSSATPPSRLLFLLSGPEPQRTLLEELLVNQLVNFPDEVVIVRGLPHLKKETTMHVPLTEQSPALTRLYGKSRVTIVDHLPAPALQAVVESATFIVCRSGYSTLMEMIPQHKKLILIPTPGQPEQEYLGKLLDRHHYAPRFDQANFSLSRALEKAREYPYAFPTHFEWTPLPTIVKEWVSHLALDPELSSFD